MQPAVGHFVLGQHITQASWAISFSRSLKTFHKLIDSLDSFKHRFRSSSGETTVKMRPKDDKLNFLLDVAAAMCNRTRIDEG